MRAEVQTTKTYRIVLDETEKLKLIEELQTILPGDNRYALHDLRIVLEALE